MTLKHLLFSSLMLLSAGSAWADVRINAINFPDANFRSYLTSQPYGSDGLLTDAEIAEIKSLMLSSKNIQNLNGIKNFTALQYLSCDGNQLTSLDVSGCESLIELDGSNNKLTSLDVSGCTALTSIICAQNQLKGDAMNDLIESLPTTQDGGLYIINVESDGNAMNIDQVKRVNAKGWIAYALDEKWNEYTGGAIPIDEENFPDEKFRNYLLRESYGSDGKLTGEEIAGVTSIDVSSKSIQSLKGIEYFTELTRLDCYYNQLTSLDVSKNTALEKLLCWINQLTSLDVSKNTALTELDCGSNQLTSLDVTKNTALTGLNCRNNQLTSLDVSKNTALTELDCGSNPFTSLDLSKNTALTSLSCYSNQLTSLDVSKNTALKSLSCGGNQLTSLDLSKNTALTSLSCGSNPFTSLDVSKNTALTRLDCYGNQLTSLDVTKNTALTWLECYYNQLTSLDVSKNTALKTLHCYMNQLTSLDVSKNSALEYLECYNNQLTSLDMSKNTALKYLSCYGNQLTSLDVSKNTALTSLYCYSNQLTSLDVSGCTALKALYCYQNQIKGAAMDALVASLPTVSSREMQVIYNENEQNEMTKVQVAVAKSKGWTPMKYDGTGWEELKIIIPMPDLTPEELLKIDMISSDMSSWFVDEETKIQGSNVNVTKNTSYLEYAVGSIQTADGKTHPYSYFYVPAASNANPNVGFYLPYNLKGEYDIYLVTMPKWTYQNNFDEEKHRYRFRARIWEKDEQNNFPSTGTVLNVDDVNDFVTPEVDANVITDTTFIGTYDFQHAYTDYNTPGVILQINSSVLVSQRKIYSTSMIFAGVVLVSKEYVTKVETVETSEADDSAPWYTINGVKLAEKPTAPGIYIHGGKKVVVK